MTKKVKFSRVGGLSPVIQKGYTTNDSERGYHTPPARKGFYAFIHPYFEPFLLGGGWAKVGQKHQKFEYLKDGNGNRVKLFIADNNLKDINPELKKYFIKGKHGKFDRSLDGTDISSKFWTEDIRDENGDYINCYLIKRKTLRVFSHTGELWHHLKNSTVKPFEIIKEVGDWIKTDYDTFVRALERDKIDCVKMLVGDSNFRFSQIEINTRNVYTYVSKDHLEVFIERIQ